MFVWGSPFRFVLLPASDVVENNYFPSHKGLCLDFPQLLLWKLGGSRHAVSVSPLGCRESAPPGHSNPFVLSSICNGIQSTGVWWRGRGGGTACSVHMSRIVFFPLASWGDGDDQDGDRDVHLDFSPLNGGLDRTVK
jgi:hypothetical protein